ncbi:MAG: hypothetical protein R2734_20300 [Nocardioides sp.]
MPELRGIFEGAVAEPPPEPHTPADVLRAARGADRRRRIWVVVTGAAAAVALVVAVVGVEAWHRPPPGPAPTPDVSDTVPVTPGALAALVLSHLDAAPTSVARNQSPSFPRGTVAVNFRLGGDRWQGSVVAVAAPKPPTGPSPAR